MLQMTTQKNSPDIVIVIMYSRTVEVITKIKINEKLQSSVMGEVGSERKKQTEIKSRILEIFTPKKNSFQQEKCYNC